MTQTAYAIQTIQETFTLCQRCSKKLDGSCAELCPEAEEFVNQDYVALRELPVADLEYETKEFPEPIEVIHFTKTENKIQILQEKNLSSLQISYLLNITRKNLTWHLFNIRRKLIK